MKLIHRRGHTPETLGVALADLEIEPQLLRRLVSRAVRANRDDLDGVEGLSKARIRVLAERTVANRLEVVERRRSAVNPFVKYLFRAPDGAVIEGVRIPLEQPRYSACISSQVGCALACAFCQTGRLGLSRHLEAWEMVEQVLAIRRDAIDRPVTGVVFQGQGEPLHNYDAVMQAADVLRHPCGGTIRSDRMTISTSGLLPAIERYTDEARPYRLILSLTSAFSEKRAELLPIARTYGIEDLAAAMRRQRKARGGIIHLAWVLMSGVNSDPAEARELRKLFPGEPLRVSVIDVNDPTGRFQRAPDAERSQFLNALAEQSISFVRRYSGGPDIHAACGMLAAERTGGAAVFPA